MFFRKKKGCCYSCQQLAKSVLSSTAGLAILRLPGILVKARGQGMGNHQCSGKPCVTCCRPCTAAAHWRSIVVLICSSEKSNLSGKHRHKQPKIWREFLKCISLDKILCVDMSCGNCFIYFFWRLEHTW